MPETSIGRLVTNRDEAIGGNPRPGEEWCRLRIKLAMDGTLTRDNGELVAAFTQDETSVMVTEAHRLGKKVVAHARGREATLYSSRAPASI